MHPGSREVPAGSWLGSLRSFSAPRRPDLSAAPNVSPSAFPSQGKNHDGFAMYHSKASRYNIVDATPFDRDPVKELAVRPVKKPGLAVMNMGSIALRRVE